jgi:hypothetical protein
MIGLLIPIVQFWHLSEGCRSDMRNHALHCARSGLNLVSRCPKDVWRRFLPMTVLAILHLSDFVAKYSNDDRERMEAVDLCASVLQENRTCFKLSGPLLQMFRAAMREYDASLAAHVDAMFGSDDQYGMDDLLEAYNRLDYVQPTEQILRMINEDFEAQWIEAIRNESKPTRGISVTQLIND